MVLDMRLPGKSGIQVLKEVKAAKPQIKSIIITAYPSTELAAEVMKLGAVDYLIKPVVPDDLERLIRETLHWRCAFQPLCTGVQCSIVKVLLPAELEFL